MGKLFNIKKVLSHEIQNIIDQKNIIFTERKMLETSITHKNDRIALTHEKIDQ